MVGKSHSESRRKTPWDGVKELTATQEFLQAHYKEHYVARHTKLSESGEAALVNSFVPTNCPYCGSEQFSKRGLTANGIQRYICSNTVRHSCQLLTLFLTDAKYLSVSGWSIA